MRAINNKLSFTFSLIIVLSISVLSQPQDPTEIKWLRVGSLHSWFSAAGMEVETGRTGSAVEQLDGLRWDAQFLRQDTEAAKAIWIGTTNYFDRILNQTIPHKVISIGTRIVDPIGMFIPIEFKMLGKFSAPTVIVDGETATENKVNDIVDEIVDTLKPDRMIINVLNSTIGLTFTRKLMAFSQQNHDNYYIYDYTFKNTGIYNVNGDVENKTLTDVYFFFQYRYAFGLEAYPLEVNPPYTGWGPSNNITWGRNAVNQQIGTNPTAPGFEMRAQYSWYGRHSQGYQAPPPFQSPILGLPNHLDGGDGHISTPQFVGTVTIHADKTATDKSDDLNQPRTTHHVGNDTDYQSPDQFNVTLMSNKYGVITRGHANPTQANAIGNGFADQFGADAGGFAQGQGFGPYTLYPGDSIRIILAEGISGLSRVKCYEIGANWKSGINGQITDFTLPNSTITNDPNLYLNTWVMTGEDSILQTFRRAIQNYLNGYNIPQPPPPPNIFEVNSGGDRISLTWSGNAESSPNFMGYKIYRAVTKPDTFYTLIADVPAGANSFDDTTARRGFEYYYYIQSYDNGSTNDVNPGVPLVSSRFYTMTNKPAFLRRPAKDALSEIRIVPNPVDIRTNPYQGRIAFFGLPPECTIRIFTERGDLIQTIEHTNGSGDELWYGLTSSEQIPVSGLYIAYFEVTKDVLDDSGNIVLGKGESTFKKFIIIR
jgi:hypothetical protein